MKNEKQQQRKKKNLQKDYEYVRDVDINTNEIKKTINNDDDEQLNIDNNDDNDDFNADAFMEEEVNEGIVIQKISIMIM